MHIYYIKRRANQDSGQQRRGYRRSPGRPTDSWRQPATPTRTTAPPPSSSKTRYDAGYTPTRVKEPTTSPPLKRNVMNTDPELQRVVFRQSRVPREDQMNTQKLVPIENDEPSLSDHLKRFAVEIMQAFKRMPLGPRFVSVAILFGLFLVLHLLWQVAGSLINLIYLILGIITSIIIIYEFVKKNSLF